MGKVLSEPELMDAVARDRGAGRSIALANGCFDLLHVGHVRYLQAAAAEASRLIVAVNDDETVTRLKGPGRPAMSAVERAEIVAALEPVDYVVIFRDATADALLRAIRPAVYAKGADYAAHTLPEAATAQEVGAQLAFIPLVPGRSTSALAGMLQAGR